MSELLQRIANYFVYQYKGNDKVAPKMDMSVDDLRNIVVLHVEKCKLEAELRNLQYVKTNADRIRNMSDEELAEFLNGVDEYGISSQYIDVPCDCCCEKTACDKCWKEWLKLEAE